MELPSTTSPATTTNTTNAGFAFQFLKTYIPQSILPKYIHSEWSYAQIHGLEGKTICAFDKNKACLYILSSDGTMLVCSYEGGGECERLYSATYLRAASYSGMIGDV